MEIVCKSCSAKLNIPDSALPKDVPVVNGKCPKCHQLIEIRIQKPGQAAAPAAAPATAPATPPVDASAPAASAASQQATPAPAPESVPPEPAPSTPAPMPEDSAEVPVAAPPEEEFSADRRLAMACFNQAEMQSEVKQALESIGYAVHTPARGEDALHWLPRHKYEVLLIHEEFGGGLDKNVLLKAIQPLAMAQRRHICVGLVGKELRTFDNMEAFALSVNFVVSEKELGKIKAITRQAVADNDQFYSVFREALREVGKI